MVKEVVLLRKGILY